MTKKWIGKSTSKLFKVLENERKTAIFTARIKKENNKNRVCKL